MKTVSVFAAFVLFGSMAAAQQTSRTKSIHAACPIIPMFIHDTVPPGEPEMKALRGQIQYSLEETSIAYRLRTSWSGECGLQRRIRIEVVRGTAQCIHHEGVPAKVRCLLAPMTRQRRSQCLSGISDLAEDSIRNQLRPSVVFSARRIHRPRSESLQDSAS